MKFKNNALLLMGSTAAFGWFILRGIPFFALLPLPLLGWLFHRLMQKQAPAPLFFNGLTLLAAALIGSRLVSLGLFQGKGFVALFLLIFAAGLMGQGLLAEELLRISRWWAIALAAVFLLMLLGALPGLRIRQTLPPVGELWEIAVFYLLVFLEPLSLGSRYSAAPMLLSVFLLPFGIAAWLTLGTGAFSWAEYPYLAVWSGVSFLSVHHIEGIILGFYYGALTLRSAEFFVNLRKSRCIKEENMVK